jgi:hypothetical protein
MKHLDLVPQYQDLRVAIRWQTMSYLKSERLGRALKIARMLSPDLDYAKTWPRNAKFSPWESPWT